MKFFLLLSAAVLAVNGRTVQRDGPSVGIVGGAENITVSLGAHNVYYGRDGYEITGDIEVAVHPDWTGSESEGYNVAVLTLPEAAPETEEIKVIDLAQSDPEVGSTVTVTGWGIYDDEIFDFAKGLRSVDVDTIEATECQESLGMETSEGILCTSGGDGKGTCWGDSGSPVVLDGKLVGVVSNEKYYECESGLPSSYSSVAHYAEWILSQ